MYFTPYIDGNGVHIPSYEDRLENLISSYRNIFGPEINLAPSSPDYQLLSVFAKALDDLSQIILVDFASRNPQYASGLLRFRLWKRRDGFLMLKVPTEHKTVRSVGFFLILEYGIISDAKAIAFIF